MHFCACSLLSLRYGLKFFQDKITIFAVLARNEMWDGCCIQRNAAKKV